MCKKPVKNKNINKDGHYFCGNNCEADYWHNSGWDLDEKELKEWLNKGKSLSEYCDYKDKELKKTLKSK